MKKKIFYLFLVMLVGMMSLNMSFAKREFEEIAYDKDATGVSSGVTVANSAGETFAPGSITGSGGTLPKGTTTMVNGIFGAIKAACMVVAIFLIVFFGIKYLTAGAGEKAKTKEMMVPFLIGAALIMLAPTIVEWIWGILGGTGSAS